MDCPQFLAISLWVSTKCINIKPDLSNTLKNLCIALYCVLLYCFVLNCVVLLIHCYVDIIQYNAVHKFVGVLDNPPRLASKISYYLSKARTNYGKFNIRFSGIKVWNSIEDSLKSKSRTCFKILLKESLISNYWLVHWCTFIFQFLRVHIPLSIVICVCACVWTVSIVLCSVGVLANFFPLGPAT